MNTTESIADIAERALRKGNEIGCKYGFESAILTASALIFQELPFEQAKALVEKLVALKPEAQS